MHSDLSSYYDLIARKKVEFEARGLKRWRDLPDGLFPHQRHGVEFALRAGCSGLFYDTGLGKSFMALAWGERIIEATNKPVLMLAPLAVAGQHAREAQKFGIDAVAIREPSEVTRARIYITNYDRLGKFDASQFAGVILDESSILKSFTGSTQRALTGAFASTKYRLACTATPAPNDHTELGQHSNFLGVMESPEMLSRWFIADQTEMGRYRLKKSAVRPFWDWVASWSRAVSKPSDLGFSDDGFVLPELRAHRHSVRSDVTHSAGEEKDGQMRLFRMPEMSATSIHREKRFSLEQRADLIGEIVAREPSEPWVIWCETNEESDALVSRLPREFVEVRGSQSADEKEEKLTAFSTGAVRGIISKPSLAGFGLNWQHSARVAFVGLSFSYEQYYQAVRRCWRFGQKRPVDVHIACADSERSIFEAVTRKAEDHSTMKSEMAAAMKRASRVSKVYVDYNPETEATLPAWLVSRG